MSARSSSLRRLWFIERKAVRKCVFSGVVQVGERGLEIAGARAVTTRSLFAPTPGLMLELVELRPAWRELDPSEPVDPKD